MPKSKLEFINGDKSGDEYPEWSNWLAKAAKLVDRHISCVDDDDPFAYNETASVALLASAAALAGHVALAEYSVTKIDAEKASSGKLKKRKRNGRGDLWLHAGGQDWAFEFKQRNSVGVSRANGRLQSLLNDAERCAKQIYQKKEGTPVAGLIVSLYFIEDVKPKNAKDRLAEAAAFEIERFAKEQDLLCWKITPPEGRRPTYFMFRSV